MTTRELPLNAIKNADFQIFATIAGLDSQAAETWTSPESMTIRQQVAHTAEAGSGRFRETWRTRQDARAAAVAAIPEDDDSLWQAYNPLAAHDDYHVGQVSAARRVVHPEWDTYSLLAELAPHRRRATMPTLGTPLQFSWRFRTN